MPVQYLRAAALTLLFLLIVTLSWTRSLDDIALSATESTFKRALTVAAVARAFNGVISVAQGTEVAIHPVGVGVTLTLGEILDPINDLVERFSMLALIASVSLGLQITLGEIFATVWFSSLVTAAAAVCIFFLWRRPRSNLARISQRVLGGFIFLRFFIVLVLLVSHWADVTFLRDRQEQSLQQLSSTTAQIEQLQQEQVSDSPVTEEEDFLDRTTSGLRSMLSRTQQTLDVKAQLQAVQDQVESSVEEIINLIVIFVLQTLLIPLGTLAIAWWSLQAYGRFIRS
ncbi:MAG: hypothetical protein RIC89_04820 [Pseudomonadales bacterium]